MISGFLFVRGGNNQGKTCEPRSTWRKQCEINNASFLVSLQIHVLNVLHGLRLDRSSGEKLHEENVVSIE